MTRISTLICLFLLATSTAFSQTASLKTPENPAVDSVLGALSRVREFAQTAISPDGKHVAWVEWLHRGADLNTAIYISDLDRRGKQRQITATKEVPAMERELAWSPDSRKVAFFSDAGNPGQLQLYVADVGSGAARRLTDVSGALSSPAWAPDGRRVAALFIENSRRAAGPLQPMTPDAGVVDDLILEQRIITVDIRSGDVTFVSPSDTYVYEYDWAPDGNSFVAVAAHGSGDDNWWMAQLYLVPAAGGEARSIYKPRLQIANPRFSPDGKQIAFIEGLMSDQGATGGDIFVVPVGGGDARNLTPKIPASPSWLEWTAPDRILFVSHMDGNAGIGAVDTKGQISTLWTAAETVTAGDWAFSLSVADDGWTTAVVRSSAQRGQEVWVGPIGSWTQVTHANAHMRPLWGELRSLHWTSDQYRVQGWLLFPNKYDPARRYPLIVRVHGGPASACTAGWPDGFSSPLAAMGYFVLCPNPRGSFGQGESFTQGNVKDLGGGDFRDIMAGVDDVLKKFPIDPNRIGIQGWSYGGYMTMWAETQTSRFRAAVAGAGLANFQSYYGQNDIDQWMIPYFGSSVYDDPAIYAKSSPITYVKNVKTPTLILVGDRDGEVPAPQSYEWWHALKTLGVPVQLVVYPNEGHMIVQPEHRRDIILRSISWFEKYMPEPKASSAAAAK